jgi:mannose-1-phosphate guanylyltransferase
MQKVSDRSAASALRGRQSGANVKTRSPVYALILAGGGGTRLWPLSRLRQPKHLLPVCGPSSLLSQTWERLQPLVPKERLLVITVAEQADATCAELAGLAAGNVVVEPAGRGTAACVGLAALMIRRRDPDATMIALPADHTIADGSGFRSVLRAAVQAAREGHLVTLGIVPTSPETGYGYIRRGALHSQNGKHSVFRVERFAEKPDLAAASAFLATGQYYWNSGIFVWQVRTILNEIRQLLPGLYHQLTEIEPALGTPRQTDAIAQVWPNVRNLSVDVGIMEHAQDVVVVPADVGWSDVGSWSSVSDQHQSDPSGNVLEGEHVVVDCEDMYIRSSGRLVAAVGLHGMVVIETDDAVLVCPKDRVQDVKRIVERLKQEGRESYL